MAKLEIYDVVFWGLLIFALIMTAWRIFGDSPNVEGVIMALLGSEFLLWRYMYRHGREIEKVSNKLEKLDSIERSLEEIKNKNG